MMISEVAKKHLLFKVSMVIDVADKEISNVWLVVRE